MGFDEGDIVLDSEAGCYYSGQNLLGKMRFRLDKVKKFRGIYVQVTGKAHVHWSSHQSRRRDGRTETYTVNHNADEEYLHVKEYLVGGPKGECQLQPGDHEFPFQCHIPPSCPSSYDGAYGYVQYKVKIVVDRAFKLDQEKERVFTVIAPLDWKNTPYCRDPIQMELEATYCSWCASAGSCETVLKAPRAGYRVGQSVPVELSCVNHSSVTINSIKLQIVKKTTFHAHSAPGTKTLEEKIVEVSKGSIAGGTVRNWKLQMEIPIMDPCNLAGCRIIDVVYNFEIKVKTAGCHSNSEQSRHIIIGDTPSDDNDVSQNGDRQITIESNQPIPIAQNIPPVPYPMAHNTHPHNPTPPYPSGNTPYPIANPTYPSGNTTYPIVNTPYPIGNTPYPSANPPYPGYQSPNVPFTGIPGSNLGNPGVSPPYPVSMPALPPKSAPIGFNLHNENKPETALLLPYPANPVPGNPYARATAPPIVEEQPTEAPGTTAPQAPYNPDFNTKQTP